MTTLIGVRRIRRSLARQQPRWLVRELLLLPVGVLAGCVVHSPVPAAAAILLVFPSCRWRARRRAVREERARAAAVIELCAALAGELRSGATPEQALRTVTGPGRATAGLVRRLGAEAVARLVAGRYGADVPAALRWLASLPGGGGASAIAACWQVTTDSGTGLAAALDQVAEALRADRALQEEIQSELAGPRTTAGMLAALPLFGLLLGSSLGAEPVRILLRTPLGLGCLAAGVLLETAGLLWTARIVRQALADLGVRAGSGTRATTRASAATGGGATAGARNGQQQLRPRHREAQRRGPCRAGANTGPRALGAWRTRPRPAAGRRRSRTGLRHRACSTQTGSRTRYGLAGGAAEVLW
ncbi:type II secretion system F family protein [Kitasatospora azatica]|uniref:type II secretion system F family protein n=1 Tax=Kitasatospora azatica TaxID=58347 RepID=UPI002277220D|nr:type II secretion system F family protein [Kitasatospora azatica]